MPLTTLTTVAGLAPAAAANSSTVRKGIRVEFSMMNRQTSLCFGGSFAQFREALEKIGSVTWDPPFEDKPRSPVEHTQNSISLKEAFLSISEHHTV
jgi:hypothetical protein